MPIDDFFAEYKNREKLSKLLEYWLYSLLVLETTYDKKGLEMFLKSEIGSVLRFSYQYEFEVQYPTGKKEDCLSKIYSIFFVFQNLLEKIELPGSNILAFTSKIKYKMINTAVENISLQIDEQRKINLIVMLEEYFPSKDKFDYKYLLELKLPNVFFSKKIKSINPKKIKLIGAAHTFMDFMGYEKLLIIDRPIVMKGRQHGGGYDIFKDDFYTIFEQELCDEFIGWGFSKHNQKQFRFKNKLEDLDSLFNKTQRRIIWLERPTYPGVMELMNLGQYLQFKCKKVVSYISNELRLAGFDFFSIPYPISLRSNDYSGLRGSLLDEKKSGEEQICKNDIVIFDNCCSTLTHFCIENDVLFLIIINKSSLDFLSERAREWLLLLRENHLVFFEDEEGLLAQSIKNLHGQDQNIPLDVHKYHRRLFF
tara:strand:+ start:180 stop:1448 length:1269 start_codon:yes stop_codon:yes gene_type:complete